MDEFPRISEAEWAVMEVVWASARQRTAQEIAAEIAPPRGWSERTVKTLLARLVKKGALGYAVEGKRYRYHAAVTREEGVRAESRSFLERVLGGRASPALAYFVREARLSQQEIDELRRLLREKEGR